MPYDPTLYQGSAPYYAAGRPPYSRAFVATLAAELRLDGSGRLLDVGCGPGVLAIEFARQFTEGVAVDPDAAMLAEGTRQAQNAGIKTLRWIQARAEDIPELDLGTFRLVTFGQSFQWTERDAVAQAVYDVLEPGGAIAIIDHRVGGRPKPESPGFPPIPHEAIRALIAHYLGPRRRAGRGFRPERGEPYADTLTRAGFPHPATVFAPGRPDIVQDVDGVLANYLSTSFAAPHLFGDRLDAFTADIRAELAATSPSGRFWDWPGDTEIRISRKPDVDDETPR